MLYNYINSASRYILINFLSKPLHLYTVNEYPKSGGTWLGLMLSALLEIPFPRNRLPVLSSSILHCHYLNILNNRKVIIVWRDGRDLIISWYYHCLVKNDLSNAKIVNLVSRELGITDPRDITKHIVDFIEYSFTRQKHPSFSWAEFVRHWHKKENVIFTKYETLRSDTELEMSRIYRELTGLQPDMNSIAGIVNRYSFKTMSGREPGQVKNDSFIRKGIVGDWKNIFPTEAKKVFSYYAQKELEILEYEKNDEWIYR